MRVGLVSRASGALYSKFTLGQLKSWHIYLELLYVRWYDRFSRIGADIPVSEQEDRQMLEELRSLPEQLPLYQRQVQRFFDLVLDVDQAGRDPQKQAAAHYLYDAPKDPELFVFHPIPLSFEPVELGRCSSVLCGARDHRPAVQELRPLVPTDRPSQCGVL